MMAAIDMYLAMRRATGFTLSTQEYLLRSFARFAGDRQQAHIRSATAIDWASEAVSLAQRHARYQTVCRFATYVRLEDDRHDCPPANYFGSHQTRRVPHIYSAIEIHRLIRAAEQLVPNRFTTSVQLRGIDQSSGGDRPADLGSAASSYLRYHARRPPDPQDKIPENPPSTAASNSRFRTTTVPGTTAENALRWRPRVCLQHRASARVLEGSRCLSQTAEDGRAHSFERPCPALTTIFGILLRSGRWRRVPPVGGESADTWSRWQPISVTSTSTPPTGTCNQRRKC